jgi:hypothetical protein
MVGLSVGERSSLDPRKLRPYSLESSASPLIAFREDKVNSAAQHRNSSP